MRPRSSEDRRGSTRRRGLAFAAAGAALAGGFAAAFVDGWSDAPVVATAAAAPNAWLAAARGEPVGVSTRDPLVVDPPPASTAPPAHVRIDAPATLAVGEMEDVVVALDASAHVGRLSFRLRVDPNVLRVESDAPDGWTIAGHADAVARIRVQAMAAGATTVRLADVVAEDEQGRPMKVALDAAVASLTAIAPQPVATANAPAGPVTALSASD